MKKFLSVLLISVLVFSIGAIAFADSSGSEVPEWFKDKMNWKRNRIDENVKNGDITEKQATEYREHLSEMEEYHNENGFDNEKFNGQGMGFRRGNKDGNRRGFGGYCHNY